MNCAYDATRESVANIANRAMEFYPSKNSKGLKVYLKEGNQAVYGKYIGRDMIEGGKRIFVRDISAGFAFAGLIVALICIVLVLLF